MIKRSVARVRPGSLRIVVMRRHVRHANLKLSKAETCEKQLPDNQTADQN
jgi:hypothetical protein